MNYSHHLHHHRLRSIGALVSGLAILLSALVQPVAIQAQGLRLTTSPLPISLKAKPGQTVTTELRIRNSGAQDETLKVGLMKFSANDQTGAAQLEEKEAGDDYFNWVTFSQSQFTLAPNQWQSVTMTIKVPISAAFAYYYAATFTRVDKDGNDLEQQAAVVGSTATLVLLAVDRPDAKRDLSITQFKANKSWYEFLPASFSITLRNAGNVHAMVQGDIFISRGVNGQTITTIPINQLQGNILPNSQRTFTGDWTQGFPHYTQPAIQDGQTPKPELKWDFSQADTLRFGKYTAHVTLVYDDGQRDVPLEQTIEFWVVPWRLIIGLLLVSSLTLFGLFTISRSIWRFFHRQKEDDLY